MTPLKRLLLVCIATVLLGSSNGSGRWPANIFLNADGALQVSGSSSGPATTLLDDPDFHWILDWSRERALVSGSAEGAPSALLLVEADGAISVLSDRAGVARFSPDGRSVLFTRDLVLQVKRPEDAAPRALLAGVLDADWSPDGESLVLTRIDPDAEERHWLALYDLRSGTVRDLTGRPFSDWGARFHPSGRWVLFASTRDPGGLSALWRVDTDGASLAQVTNLPGEPQVPTPSGRAIWSPDGRRVAFDAVDDDGSRTIWVLTLSEDGVLDRAEPVGAGVPYSWLSNTRLLAVERSGEDASPAVLELDR